MAIQTGWGSQWETLANAINDYYGAGVGGAQYTKVVNMLNSGEYTMEEMESILAQIPEFSRTYNAEGQLINVSYNVSSNAATSTAGTVAQQVNSNVTNATQTQFSTVQTITKDAQTGKVAISDNLVKYKTGQLAPTTMKGIPVSALQGVLATSAGITAGKKISQLAYDKGFNWLSWAGVDMGSLNPETWATITQGDSSLGAAAFNMILGLDDNNNPQPYITQETLAYMIAYMGAVGVFNSGGVVLPETQTTGGVVITSRLNPLQMLPLLQTIPRGFDYSRVYNDIVNFVQTYWTQDRICILTASSAMGDYSGWGAARLYISQTSHPDNSTITLGTSENFYCLDFNAVGSSGQPLTAIYVRNAGNSGWIVFTGERYGNYYQWSDINGEEASAVEGIDDQEGATVFNGSGISDWTDIAAVLAALKTQFPELWDERVEVSPDGDTTITYIPVGFPTGGTGQQPTTDGAVQSDLTPDITGDGDNSTDELIKTLIEMITHPQTAGEMESDTTAPTSPVDPNGDPRGTGETPAIVFPTGSASALWKIYNPSQSQLDTFGAWLWSSNFVDQLLKVFNDPMQAIIGLHKIYATPPTSGSGAIKVGYLVSDASANYVSAQYTEIDCGTVNLKEYFNNVFDYDPFTKVSIFLPFIGFRQLNISDIMRGDISVKYGIDVLTGACLAKISVTRDLNENVLYTFAGNCAVQYPVSSGSYVGILTGLLGIAGGIAGTIASGGALAPMLMGAGASVGAMHTNVEHSGNIGSNAGAMGIKKPYIVIERPQTKIPLYGVDIEGKPQNETVILGSCSGHVRVKAAEYNGFSCTAGELTKIKQLLSSGIII